MWEVEILNFWRGWVQMFYETEEKARRIFELNSGDDDMSQLNKIIRLRNPDGEIEMEVNRGSVW